MSIIGIVNS